MDQVGICSVCSRTGPLEEIQEHFASEHITDNLDEELGANTENTSINEATSEATEEDAVVDANENSLRWPKAHVLLLIRSVEEHYSQFESGLKKNVWIKIATRLSTMTNKTYTHEQVDSKWKGLKRTYKKIKEHNSKTGNNPKKWDFFYAMDSFMYKKPEITPPAICSSQMGLQISSTTGGDAAKSQDSQESPTTSSLSEVGSASTDCQSLIMRKRKRQDNVAEKRFQEKMSRYDEFLKLYRVSVEHQIGRKVTDTDASKKDE